MFAVSKQQSDMKKSSKRFVISSEAVNTLGMRVRTSGIDISQYERNPIMLWMHQRPTGKSKDEVLPLGNFVDLEFKDVKLYGTPSFDETDAFAMSIYEKVENGTIRMASAGLKPIEWGDNPDDLWLEKSYLAETSLVDIGSNAEALGVALYDESEKVITLSDDFLQSVIQSNTKSKIDMKLITLKESEVLPLLKLAEGATPEQVQASIVELVKLAESQGKQIALVAGELKAEKVITEGLQEKLAEQVELANTEKITTLMDTAVKERKITAEESAALIELAAGDFAKLEKLMSTKTATPTLESVLDKSKSVASEGLEKLSWDDMDKSGQLVQLKADNLELFKTKYQEKFKKAYEG